MPLSGTIRFRFAGARPDADVEFAVDDDDAQTLRAFLDEVRALEDFISRGSLSDLSFSWNWEAGGPTEFSKSEPSDDDRATFLHRLRPFILEEERTAFHRVRGIVARSSQSAFLKEYLSHTKDRFTLKKSQAAFSIVSNDLVLNSEQALKVWLNAHEYHRDPSKRADLAQAHTIVPVEFTRPVLLMMLVEKATAVQHLGHVVHKMMHV
jgi:hypothetical protein